MEEDRKTLLRRFYEEVSADKRIEIEASTCSASVRDGSQSTGA